MFIVQQLRAALKKRLHQQAANVLEQYLHIVKLLNFCGWLIGAHVLSPSYSSKNWYLRFVLFNLYLVFCINLHSLYSVYGSLVDFMHSLETILFVGICTIKLYTFVWHKTLIVRMHHFIIAFIDKYSGNKEEEEKMSSTVHNIYALFVLFGLSSSAAIVLMFLYPILWSALVEYVIPFGFIIPGVAIDNLQGFLLNYVFQLYECLMTLCGIIGSECAFFMFLLNACLQMDVIRLHLKRLGILSTLNDHGQHTAEIRNLIHNIIKQHIEHLDFTQTMCNLFELHFFIVFGCISIQLISIVVVAVLNPDWYPGYFLFAMLTFQVFFSCALGQFLDKKCDELMIAIYDVPWYNLDAQDQKAMKLLLLASQQPILISYGFGTVNMRTFFEIYRRTYSIGMMMINVDDGN